MYVSVLFLCKCVFVYLLLWCVQGQGCEGGVLEMNEVPRMFVRSTEMEAICEATFHPD